MTATSHKVIRNLLDEVVDQAGGAAGQVGRVEAVRVGHKVGEVSEHPGSIAEIEQNEDALAAIGRRRG